MLMEPPKKYHHGNLREALCRATLQLLDAGGIEDVGLRDSARVVRVSASAAYRHFENKEELLAAVAAEGFRELAATLRTAADAPDPAIAVGFAYVEFALKRRGLFCLMFGPTLLQKEEYPALNKAVVEAGEAVARSSVIGNDSQALAAWGLYHGLSMLLLGNLMTEANAEVLAQGLLAIGLRRRDETPGAAAY